MDLKISLDNLWTDGDYGVSVAEVIRDEIKQAVKREIRAVVGKAIKDNIRSLQAEIEAEIKRATPKHISDLLKVLKEAK